MVKVDFDNNFEKIFSRLDPQIKEKVIKQIIKLRENPRSGKPMKNIRKGTRELYIAPYRLSYSYEKDKIILLDLYHKDEQ